MDTFMPILASISGDSLIRLVVVLIVVGVVLWLLDFLVTKIGMPDPFPKVIRIILLIIGVLFICNGLLSLIGHGFISF